MNKIKIKIHFLQLAMESWEIISLEAMQFLSS